MKTTLQSFLGGLAFASALIVTLQPSIALAQGTAFTYQGRLDAGGAPYTGLAEMQCSLWNAASGGSQLGSTLTLTPVGVTNGLFTVTLDFGSQFPGANRWLEIAVRTNLLGFTTLAPRQPITATPYAITAGHLTGPLPASQLSGTLPSANLGGTYSGAVTLNNTANSFTGSGAGLTSLNASQLTTGTVPDDRLAANVARTNQVWLLGGNAGTTPGTHFVGTTDNQPLEIKVNGVRALRLEPTADYDDQSNIVNVVVGSPANRVAAGVVGATIAGGGAVNFYGADSTNLVATDFGTIGGGLGNTIDTIAAFSTIGGGAGNTIHNGAHSSTIGGGVGNTIQTDTSYATIGGGYLNLIQPSAWYASIPGGFFNSATRQAFAAGTRAKANHIGSFVWGDSTWADVASTTSNSVTFRASGGYRLFSNSGLSAGVSLAPGGGSWTSISDRHAKENFEPVDAHEILEKVLALPLSRWNYKSQDPSIRHLGPMAQDFKAAFGLGESDTGITTVDADGVALAAIQGLNAKVESGITELAELRAENAALKARLERLEQLLTQQLNSNGP